MILKWRDLLGMIDEFKNHKIDWIVLGFTLFLFGIMIIVVHNVWTGSVFQIAITVLGWGVTIKGLFLLLIPDAFMTKWVSSMSKPVAYQVGGVLFVLLGTWLSISGFVL